MRKTAKAGFKDFMNQLSKRNQLDSDSKTAWKKAGRKPGFDLNVGDMVIIKALPKYTLTAGYEEGERLLQLIKDGLFPGGQHKIVPIEEISERLPHYMVATRWYTRDEIVLMEREVKV